MKLYWLLERGEEVEQAVAVVGVDGQDRSFRALGGSQITAWSWEVGDLRLHPVRSRPLTEDLDEALQILVDRVEAAADQPREV